MSSTLRAQVEQKFYLRWINFLLYPTYQITDLSDLKDGYLLVKICEMVLDIDDEQSVLVERPSDTKRSSQDLSMSSTKLSKSKKKEWAMNNITEAYNYCDKMGADVYEIPGEDILAGKVSSIVNFLALLGQTIYVSGIKFQGVTGETALLQWVREVSMGMLPGGMTSFSGWYISYIKPL